MSEFEQPHPWVSARQGKIGFGVQVFPLATDPDPTESVIEAGILAQRVGLDAFFIGDHPGYHIEPWLHLAHIAGKTSTIQLGSVVNCIFHRHPAMLARMTADLDRISNGRAVLGLGIGWNESEFAQLGVPFLPTPQRQDALDEGLSIINGMFGADPITFKGEHWWVSDARITSPPVQAPRPPILVAGAGKRTLRQVARWADISNFGGSKNTGNVQTNDDVRLKLDELDRNCSEIGRAPATLLKSHFTSWLMLAETNDAAKAKLDSYFPDGLTEEQTRTRVWGDPANVIGYYQELAALGFTYFVVQVQDSRDLRTVRLLGEAVAPYV